MRTLILSICLAMFAGCVPRGQIAPGADPLVVQAEALAESAGDSMDTFVQWEYRNQGAVGADVTAAADLVREFGPKYLRQLKTATRLYKAARSPDNKLDLNKAIAQLQSLLDQAREHFKEQAKP